MPDLVVHVYVVPLVCSHALMEGLGLAFAGTPMPGGLQSPLLHSGSWAPWHSRLHSATQLHAIFKRKRRLHSIS